MKDEKVQIDLGCGMHKRADTYIGIDINKYEGVDVVQDLRFTRLPFDDGSVDEAYSSHFLEHLTFEENLHLFNEVWRILKPTAKFEIIVPHGFSYAGMADLSHKTFWTEDTFGYFSPQNVYYYEWFYEKDGQRIPVVNRWKVLKNDTTPPVEYTTLGWVTVKLREIHAVLERLPEHENDDNHTN